VGCWYSSRFNLQIGIWQITWPMVVMGFGFGMIFPPSSAAAISCVAHERMGYAASLYNMMRNTGAAVGIAWMSNVLVSYEQVHQSRLVEHFSVFDAWRLTNMGRTLPGAPDFNYAAQLIMGQKQSLGMLYDAIQAQSTMLAFNDIYLILTVISLIMIPSFLLMRGAKPASGRTMH
jgi:MFS transporter, DHA2 family, multidrug resistance protein